MAQTSVIFKANKWHSYVSKYLFDHLVSRLSAWSIMSSVVKFYRIDRLEGVLVAEDIVNRPTVDALKAEFMILPSCFVGHKRREMDLWEDVISVASHCGERLKEFSLGCRNKGRFLSVVVLNLSSKS